MFIKIIPEPYKTDAQILHLRGSIDPITDQDFRDHLFDALDASRPHVLLQMKGVKYLSSTGLSVLFELKKKQDERKGALGLYDSQLSVKRVLEIVRLQDWELSLDNVDKNHPFYDYIAGEDAKKQAEKFQQETLITMPSKG